MSVPTLNTGIIEAPQSIVINQVPLGHTVIQTNVPVAVPIATTLTQLTPAIDPNRGEIKTGIVPIGGTPNLIGIQTVPVQNVAAVKAPVAAPPTPAGTSEHHEILPKSRLGDLVREVDPNLVLEDEVEELLLGYVDEFIDRVLKGACTITKHRQNNVIEVRDVQQFINRNYNIWTPGSGTDELKPYKRNMVMESHKQRMALIRRALKKY